jgi:hypothetical protein
MILFLVFNIALLTSSLYLLFQTMLNYSVLLSLPTPLIIVYVIGVITPLLNIYDSIKNLLSLTVSSVDEDSM